MNENALAISERIPLVATNIMRIAGIQGVYGDPNGITIFPISLEEILRKDLDEVVLIDAGSTEPLFTMLEQFRRHRPLARTVVIGLDQDDTYIECVIAAGAKGFLGANASAEEFRYALFNVREGSLWATRKVLSRLAESQLFRQLPGETRTPIKFTQRERQIIGLLLAGKGNREISESLEIEAVTVKSHLARIMRKAGVANRIELTMFAVRNRASSARETQSRRPRQIN